MKLALSFLLLALPAFAGNQPDLYASLAFHDEAQNAIVLQGESGRSGIAGACATEGEQCGCVVYTNSEIKTQRTYMVTSRSVANGTVTCNLNGFFGTSEAYVMLRSPNHGDTALLPLKREPELTLQDLLGNLAPSGVNKVYKYSCERTFFEGEGVTNNSLSCLPGQRLGLITASYDYYLFSNEFGEGNLSKKFAASFFPSLCERPASEITRNNCTASTPDPRFGLYQRAAGPFQIRIQLTSAPEATQANPELTKTYGFAASPDSAGKCGPGLAAAHPYDAKPASITAGSINGINPPSNFINLGDGNLNNTVLETQHPWAFYVRRQANATPCHSATGSCASATFDGMTTAQEVPYVRASPMVCVIPARLLR